MVFTARVWQFIVDKTNEYPAHKVPKWTSVSIEEMKAFIGIILLMGVIRLPRIKDYCFTLQTCNLTFFHKVMSHNRFPQIFNVLEKGIALGSIVTSGLQNSIVKDSSV